jgi:hypothetical protein
VSIWGGGGGGGKFIVELIFWKSGANMLDCSVIVGQYLFGGVRTNIREHAML